ncbi:MAG TPA: VTC domain-containing protein [Polyangiales bacterium]|nr:VTC domain-containing protein [Polyangiales bacterium]
MSRTAAQESSALTRNRRELKFKLAEAHAAEFAAAVAARVPKHRFSGRGANRLPRARHYVTTVYFDTAARDLYRAVREDADNLKIRAREYYDLHPELLELATDPRDIVRYSPVLWIEIKGKREGRTYKRRIGIPKGDLSPFFERGEVSQAMRDIQRAAHADSAHSDDVIGELGALCARFSQPLRASCLVNYRRTAFEDPAGALRVTFDQRVACFAAADSLWNSEQPLVREALGTPAHEEQGYILEVKSHGELPAWLADLLEQHAAEQHGLSKFVTASEAVHGPLKSS